MKLEVNENGEIVLGDVFNPVVVTTPNGDFGICQRDGGIEVVQNGKVIFSSNDYERMEYLTEEYRLTREQMQSIVASNDWHGDVLS